MLSLLGCVALTNIAICRSDRERVDKPHHGAWSPVNRADRAKKRDRVYTVVSFYFRFVVLWIVVD